MLVYVEDKICKFAGGNAVSFKTDEDSCIIGVTLPFHSDVLLMSEKGFDVSLKRPGIIGIFVSKDNYKRASINVGLDDDIYLLDYPILYISFSNTGIGVVLTLFPLVNRKYECYDTEELMVMGE